MYIWNPIPTKRSILWLAPNLDPYRVTTQKGLFYGWPQIWTPTGSQPHHHQCSIWLHSSGLCFHNKLADTLHFMGFTPSFANHDVWMCTPSDPIKCMILWSSMLMTFCFHA